MVADRKTSIATVMLADMSLVYSLHTQASDLVDSDAWTKHGEIRLKDSYVQGLAEAAAKQWRGKVLKVWFDHGAGGYFANLEVPGLDEMLAPFDGPQG